MKKIFLVLSCALTIFTSFFLVTTPASAVDVKGSFETSVRQGGLVQSGAKELPTVASVLNEIIFAVLSLIGVLILILIIYAGFQWATARGNDTQVQTAQKTLIRGVIGLIIIFASFALTNFVLSSLSTVTEPPKTPAPAAGTSK